MSFGILIVLVPIGYFYFLSNSKKHFPNLLMLLTFVSLAPFWQDLTYALTYFLLFLSIFSGMGFKILIQTIRKRIQGRHHIVVLIIIVLFSASILPNYITVREDEPIYDQYPDGAIMNDETFNCALYLREQTNQLAFSNLDFLGEKISAFVQTSNINSPQFLQSQKQDLISIPEFFSGKYRNLWKSETEQISTIKYSVFLSGKTLEYPSIQKSLAYHLGGEGQYSVIIPPFLMDSIYENGEFHESLFLLSLHELMYIYYNDGFQLMAYLIYPLEQE